MVSKEVLLSVSAGGVGVSSSWKSIHDFFDDEIPPEWERCAYCGAPLALDVRENVVLMWCKSNCKMVLDERRVVKGEASYGS